MFEFPGRDAVQWLYECAVPGQGTSKSRVSDIVARDVTQEWAADCFQTALDDFVANLKEVEFAQEVEEPALV